MLPYHPCIFDLNLKNVFQMRDLKKPHKNELTLTKKTKSVIEAVTLPLIILYMDLLIDLAEDADGQ